MDSTGVSVTIEFEPTDKNKGQNMFTDKEAVRDEDGVPLPTGGDVNSYVQMIDDFAVTFQCGDRVWHGTRGEGSVTRITTEEMYVRFDIGETRRYFWRSVFKLTILIQGPLLTFSDQRVEQAPPQQ